MKRIKRERMMKHGSMGVGVLTGAAWSLGITLAGAAVMSGLILKEVLVENAIGYAAMGILLMSSFAGSAAAVRSIGKQPAVAAILTGIFYFGILALLNALLYKGGFEGVGAGYSFHRLLSQ